MLTKLIFYLFEQPEFMPKIESIEDNKLLIEIIRTIAEKRQATHFYQL